MTLLEFRTLLELTAVAYGNPEIYCTCVTEEGEVYYRLITIEDVYMNSTLNGLIIDPIIKE